MPYSVEKYKNGFRLVDDKGHYYSNKPMTKKAVQSQMKAVAISKHKKHKLYPQYVRETGDYEGAGFTDWIKKTASTVKDIATNIKGRIKGVITGERESPYPPDVREILQKYGNNNIIKLVVRRDPLSTLADLGSNILSLGQFEQSKKEAGYDYYFHLYCIATLDNGISLLMEKNEVIKIEIYNGSKDKGESVEVKMNNPIKLNTFLDNALKGQGFDLFSNYNPITANCQIWINGLMTYNDLYKSNPNLKQFIMQDYTTLQKNLPTISRKLADVGISLGKRWNILTKGAGFDTLVNHNLV
jgi:hypothetical protein